MDFAGRAVVVVGGSSGIGEAAAASFARRGARVFVVGRDAARCAAVAGRFGGTAHVADARRPETLAALFAAVGTVDDLVITLSGGEGAGRFATLDLNALRRGIEGKVVAQLAVVQAALPHLHAQASITIVTSASARAALPGTVGLAAINGALESALPALAAELAPVRVNAVSPGVIDTAWWERFGDEKAAIFEQTASSLPVRRVGTAAGVADLIVAVAAADFMTGTVVGIDGGAALASGSGLRP